MNHLTFSAATFLLHPFGIEARFASDGGVGGSLAPHLRGSVPRRASAAEGSGEGSRK